MSDLVIRCVRKNLKEYLVNHRLRPWLDERAEPQYEPFCASIDLRDAGFKIAPVDANFYPAGFNNVCREDLDNAPAILKQTLTHHIGKVPERVVIFPEAHTKNKFYVDSLMTIRSIFRNAGIQTEIGWLADSNMTIGEQSQDPIELHTSADQVVLAYPFFREKNRLRIEPFDPDFILLNNDFSDLLPNGFAGFDGIEQPMEPSYKLGWHTRKKSDFFTNYNTLATEFAEMVKIDPWCLTIESQQVTDVDFQEKKGLDHIAARVDEMLKKIQKEYSARNINEKPFVFIKNNSGTYGIGIMRVESAQEVIDMNRRERNKMSVGKGKTAIHDVLIQEGVYTRFEIDGAPAEPTIVLLGYDLMGGFLRKNPQRSRTDNLNAKGMVFQKLCISDLRRETDRDVELELVYGTIAQLSVAAMALEVKRTGGLQ